MNNSSIGAKRYETKTRVKHARDREDQLSGQTNDGKLPDQHHPPRPRRARRIHENRNRNIDDALFHYIPNVQNHQVVDIPLRNIETLPPYQRAASRTIVIVNCASDSDKAVSDIRSELASHHLHAKQIQDTLQDDLSISRHCQFIGFSIIRNHHGNKQAPAIAMLQLATDTTSYLFRLRHDGKNKHACPMTMSLRCLLSDQSIVKIGSGGIHTNVRELNLEYGSDCCGPGASFLSIIPLVVHRWPRLQKLGLGNITASVLRYKLHNGYNTYNEFLQVDWEQCVMTSEMEEYAASVTFVLVDLLAAMHSVSDHDIAVMGTFVVASEKMTNSSKPAGSNCTRDVHVQCDETSDAVGKINSMLEAAAIDFVRDMHGDGVVDVSDAVINTLPRYQRADDRKIVVVTSATASELAVADIRTELLVEHETSGMNCIFNSYHFIGFNMLSNLLLQIATFSTAYLFRLGYDEMPGQDGPMTESLRCLLSDLSIMKVGLGNHIDIRTLNRMYGNDCCGDGASFLDLVQLTKLRWPSITKFGVRNITAAALGYRLHKKPKAGLWKLSQTTSEMHKRAAIDAFVTLDLLAAILMPSPPHAMHSPAMQNTQPLEYTGSDVGSAVQMRKSLLRHVRDIRDLDVVDFPKDKIGTTLPRYTRPEGRIIVLVTRAADFDRAVVDIRTELSLAKQHPEKDGVSIIYRSFQFVGFDTETKPSFKKGSGGNSPALIQLATMTKAYLFRLRWKGMDSNDSLMTESLQCLLSDPSIIKVGSGIHADVKTLNHHYGRKFCGENSSYFDLIPLARNRWPKLARCGLRNLTATVLHHNLSKAQQMENWEMDVLTPAMIEYAAADAFVALDLFASIVVQFDGYNITVPMKETHEMSDEKVL